MPPKLSPNKREAAGQAIDKSRGYGYSHARHQNRAFEGKSGYGRISQPTYPTVCARKEHRKEGTARNEGNAMSVTAAPYNPIATAWGKGRRYEYPPSLDASAHWRVHAISRGEQVTPCQTQQRMRTISCGVASTANSNNIPEGRRYRRICPRSNYTPACAASG